MISGDMFAHFGIVVRPFDAQRVHVSQVFCGITPRNIQGLQPPLFLGSLNDFIIHVRKILDMDGSIASGAEETLDHIPNHAGPGMAQMGFGIGGGHTAYVDAYLALLLGTNSSFFLGQSVINIDFGHIHASQQNQSGPVSTETRAAVPLCF